MEKENMILRYELKEDENGCAAVCFDYKGITTAIYYDKEFPRTISHVTITHTSDTVVHFISLECEVRLASIQELEHHWLKAITYLIEEQKLDFALIATPPISETDAAMECIDKE